MSSKNAKWDEIVSDKIPLKPEDTIAYYENFEQDPTENLSARERAKIIDWMSSSVNSSSEPDAPQLTSRDERYNLRLNLRANALPADNSQFIQPVDIYQSLDNVWNRLYVWYKGKVWAQFLPVNKS